MQEQMNLCDPRHPDHVNARRVTIEEQLVADIAPVVKQADVPSESHPSRLDMTFTGWPDELTMTILRNMFRDKNVKVRISAEVI